MTALKSPEFFSKSVQRSKRFYLDLAPPVGVPLAVVCGGFEECADDYEVRRSTFPYYSVEVVTGGRGWLVLADREFELHPGSVFSYGPDVPHQIRSNRRSRLAKYFVDFCGTTAGELLANAKLTPGSCINISAPAELEIVLAQLLRDGMRMDDLSAPLCNAWFNCLLLRLVAYEVSPELSGTSAYETYNRCVAYIDKNAGKLSSQQEVAEACGISPAYLCRLFQKFARQTPYQHLTRARMNIAAEQLLSTSLPVNRIAQKLGFADPFHFCRVFKATYGVPPTVFRRLR